MLKKRWEMKEKIKKHPGNLKSFLPGQDGQNARMSGHRLIPPRWRNNNRGAGGFSDDNGCSRSTTLFGSRNNKCTSRSPDFFPFCTPFFPPYFLDPSCQRVGKILLPSCGMCKTLNKPFIFVKSKGKTGQ